MASSPAIQMSEPRVHCTTNRNNKMCILSLSQGHSDSCECDKCQPPSSLPDLAEELMEQTMELDQCLTGLKATETLLYAVCEQMQAIRTQVSGLREKEAGVIYQVLDNDSFLGALMGESRAFSYGLHLASQLPSRLWKNSRFHLSLTLTSPDGKMPTDHLRFSLAVYKCVSPLCEITAGVHSKVLLRGRRVQTSGSLEVQFSKLSFAEVTSNYPEKAVRLVVVCSSPQVRPFISHPVKVISRF